MKYFKVFMIILFLVTHAPINAFAEEPIKVFLNGKQIQFEENPIIKDGVTLVQFRPIFESLGYSILYFDEGGEKSVVATHKTEILQISLNIDKQKAFINSEPINLEVAPKLINGSTFVPLRFVAETSGKNVTWNGDTRVIQIENQDNKQSIKYLNTVDEIQKYLDEKYNSQSPLHTIATDLDFRVTVSENDNKFLPYDYYINFNYSIYLKMMALADHRKSIKNKNGEQEADASEKQIRDYIENMAKDIILRTPGKKILGNTENGFYRYPHLKLEWMRSVENIWANYDYKSNGDDHYKSYDKPYPEYKDTIVSDFRWAPVFEFKMP